MLHSKNVSSAIITDFWLSVTTQRVISYRDDSDSKVFTAPFCDVKHSCKFMIHSEFFSCTPLQSAPPGRAPTRDKTNRPFDTHRGG